MVRVRLEAVRREQRWQNIDSVMLKKRMENKQLLNRIIADRLLNFAASRPELSDPRVDVKPVLPQNSSRQERYEDRGLCA